MMTEPPGGTAWKPPHGYSQTVSWDGSAVRKRYSPLAARQRECIALTHLAGKLPVPPLLACSEPHELRMGYVEGTHGQSFVAHLGSQREERHRRFLSSCGAFIARLHRADVAGLRLEGKGSVLVHGDFAPYNVIMSEEGEIRAVIDWETAHLGSPVEDLAWMEWNMRIWYSVTPRALARLYEAYGTTPRWEDRHEAMLARCAPHLERASSGKLPADVAQRWIAHVQRTEGFREIL